VTRYSGQTILPARIAEEIKKRDSIRNSKVQEAGKAVTWQANELDSIASGPDGYWAETRPPKTKQIPAVPPKIPENPAANREIGLVTLFRKEEHPTYAYLSTSR
jgi:hypothetical protein